MLSDGAANNLDDGAYQECVKRHTNANGLLDDLTAFSKSLADQANRINLVREEAASMKEKGVNVP